MERVGAGMMLQDLRRSTPKLAFLVVAALGFAACVIADWPGHFPPDAINQLAQGRAGVYNFWHPPVMAWLLGLSDRIVPGAPLFFVFQAMLFFAALSALALVRGRGWLAVILAALMCASPLVLIYQGLVVKDVLFADASLAGFAALAWAVRLWRRRLARLALCALATTFLTLAMLARQNGFIVAAAGALTLAFVDLTMNRGERATRPALRFAMTAVLVLAIVSLATALATFEFRAHSDHEPEDARQWATLQIYDLAGALRRDPRLELPVLHRAAPATEAFVRRDAVSAFDPARIDPMYRLARWNPILDQPTRPIGAQWRQLIFTSPALYLTLRADAFWQVFATPRIQSCAAVMVGVDPGQPNMLRAAGLTARETDKDDWDGDYASAFLDTPVFSHIAYAVLAVALLILAARDLARGVNPELVATVGLLIGAFAFSASFFIISLACDYRYLYFLDVAAMAALAQRVAIWRSPAP
jgi:hypothetical protein